MRPGYDDVQIGRGGGGEGRRLWGLMTDDDRGMREEGGGWVGRGQKLANIFYDVIM